LVIIGWLTENRNTNVAENVWRESIDCFTDK